MSYNPTKITVSSLVCHFTANLENFDTLALANSLPENGTDRIVGLRYVHGDSVVIKGNPEFRLKRKKTTKKKGGSVKNGMSLRVRIGPKGVRPEDLVNCNLSEIPITNNSNNPDNPDTSAGYDRLPNGDSVEESRYVTVNVFAKGSINITGATDYEHTPYLARDIVYQFIEDYMGITLDEYSSLCVSNIIGKWYLGVCIINRKVIPVMAGYGLTAITTKRGVKIIVPLPGTTQTKKSSSKSFDPNEPRSAKVTFHRTGKILCCAFQNFNEMCYTYDVINHVVEECYSTLVTTYSGSLSLGSST